MVKGFSSSEFDLNNAAPLRLYIGIATSRTKKEVVYSIFVDEGEGTSITGIWAEGCADKSIAATNKAFAVALEWLFSHGYRKRKIFIFAADKKLVERWRRLPRPNFSDLRMFFTNRAVLKKALMIARKELEKIPDNECGERFDLAPGFSLAEMKSMGII